MPRPPFIRAVIPLLLVPVFLPADPQVVIPLVLPVIVPLIEGTFRRLPRAGPVPRGRTSVSVAASLSFFFDGLLAGRRYAVLGERQEALDAVTGRLVEPAVAVVPPGTLLDTALLLLLRQLLKPLALPLSLLAPGQRLLALLLPGRLAFLPGYAALPFAFTSITMKQISCGQYVLKLPVALLKVIVMR